MKTFIEGLFHNLGKKGIRWSIFFVVALIFCNSFLTYRFRLALDENQKNQEKYELIEDTKKGIIVNLNTIDMSVRGYLLVRNDAFLETFLSHKPIQNEQFETLSALLPEIGFNAAHMAPVQKKAEEYYQQMDEVFKLDKEGKFEEALEVIKKDFGTQVWLAHVEFTKHLDPFLEMKKAESQKTYDNLMAISVAFNIILFLIGIPTLLFAAYRLSKGTKIREALYKELDENNRELIFDSNVPVDLQNEKKVVGGIIENLKKTSSFIKEITNGNYDIGWSGMTELNRDKNKENIAAELLSMRDQMKKQHTETKRKTWITEGLNKLSEIIRNHQDDFQQSSIEIITFLVKYLDAQQGGLFIHTTDEANKEGYLHLSSCYAFNRKKFIEKRVEIGQGLIGQTFLEGQPVLLTKIPPGYTSITSGLGEATPDCLVIYPLIQNNKAEAIVEIASFKVLDSFSMEFLAGASKILASFIATSGTNEKTKELLEKSQQQAEELRAQEEEMRQNMEELEATQEEMNRKEKELRLLLQKYGNAEDLIQPDQQSPV